MKTTYYFAKTNAFNEVIATDGKKVSPCKVNSDGIDVNSGVDLYNDNTDEMISELKMAYAEIDGLYSMDDIEMDYPDDVYDFDSSEYEEMIEIISVGGGDNEH